MEREKRSVCVRERVDRAKLNGEEEKGKRKSLPAGRSEERAAAAAAASIYVTQHTRGHVTERKEMQRLIYVTQHTRGHVTERKEMQRHEEEIP